MPRTRTRKFTPPAETIQFRSMAFNADEWQHTKATAHARGIAVRRFIAQAVEAELEPLLASLGADQPKVRRAHKRLPVDDRVLRRLSAGRDRAGMPAVAILRLCLARHARQPVGVAAGVAQ